MSGSTDPALQPAAAFIAQFEGFSEKPYQDVGGVWTIGFGFTRLPDGSPVTADTLPMTRDEGLARLASLAADVLAAVRVMVTVPMTTNQAVALTSFAYNEGLTALRRSHLLVAFNGGDTQAAADAFWQWVYADGHYVQGLANRRQIERTLFLTPDATLADDSADALNAAELDGLT